jgi:peptide/nickel transport system ATP-binding protein
VTPLVAARGLTVSTRDGRALVGPLTLDVAPGERVGVVGASGAGKTLLVSALLGVVPPGLVTTGRLEVRGRSGLLPQEAASALEPLVPVGRQVGLVVPRARRAERVREVAASLDLAPELLTRRPGRLSGGERQRAALALALASAPDLLVADEPTSALDAETQASVLAAVDRGVGAGALVLVSHDLAAVARLCARTVVLEHGLVVEDADTPELLARPRSAAGAALARAAGRLGLAG